MGNQYTAKWTKEEDEKAIELLKAGYSAIKVAQELGRTASAIHHRNERVWHIQSPAKWTREEDQKAIEMLKSGHNLIEVARALGRTPCAARHRNQRVWHIHKNKLPRRVKEVKIDKADLERLYHEEGLSTVEIAKIYNTTHNTIQRKMKEFGIPTRTVSEAQKIRVKAGKWRSPTQDVGHTKETRAKMSASKTVYHISKEELYDLYWNKGLLIKEIAKLYHCNSMVIIERMRKYNIPSKSKKEVMNMPKVKQKIKKARMKQVFPTRHTEPELVFEEICKKHNIPLHYVGDGSLWIGKKKPLNPDFIEANGRKICVEIMGDYWHSPILNFKIKESRTLPYRKRYYKKYGWKPIFIWESDLRRDDAEQFVLNELKKNGVVAERQLK